MPLRKVLVANRGEIARRIISACKELGIQTVAVYSEADEDAPFVSEADFAYPIGGAPASESYLNIPKILEVAQQAGVDAIHPGYGFLAENPIFAQACQDAGIRFIGPRPEVIRLLGDKGEAKRVAEQVGVPTVPGFTPTEDVPLEALLEHARAIGFPVLLKAVAGGGGKGMRIVQSEEEFLPSAESARREAEGAFGDPRLMIERYIPRPRHVEVQILGDEYGNLIHLYERECSIQRRHQKIIEEAPSPILDPETRTALTDSALRLAKAVGYTNAGTCEFLVEETSEGLRFYFLEVNTRLQVEHPVTELITGVDLVHWQLRIASGEPLTLSQDSLPMRGHAIEARLYAEDPTNDFAPQLGTISAWHAPHLPSIRIDAGIIAGNTLTHHYDPMIAKVIAWAEDRQIACNRLLNALQQVIVLGVRTNLEFLIDLLSHPAFRAGALHTGFLEEHPLHKAKQSDIPPQEVLLALALIEPQEVLLALALIEPLTQRQRPVQGISPAPTTSVWEQIGHWRIGTRSL